MLPNPSKPVNHSDAIVFMGACGCGKSAVAQLFAQRSNWNYIDADDYHTPDNVAKMASGEPLTDTDRTPWLENLNALLLAARNENKRVALACSALKQSYRAILRANDLRLQFVLLDGSRELLLSRLGDRSDHFMPATLLDSQLRTLERPRNALIVDISPPLDQVVDSIEIALTANKRRD